MSAAKNRVTLSPISIVILIILAIFIAIGGVVLLRGVDQKPSGDYTSFANCFELASYINESRSFYPSPFPTFDGEDRGTSSEAAPTGGVGDDHTSTNIQEEGVDEADVVKTDGQTLFVVSDYAVNVIDVSDEANPEIIARIKMDISPSNLFLRGDKLVVFAADSSFWYGRAENNYNKSLVLIYNVADVANPQLERAYSLDGYQTVARLINNNLYVISSSGYITWDINALNAEDKLPKIYSADDLDGTNQTEVSKGCRDVAAYGQNPSSFLTVAAIDVESKEVDYNILLGEISTTYVSGNNIYLSTPVYDEEGGNDFVNPTVITSTSIFKLRMEGQNLENVAEGKVVGTVLNQFSMGEFQDNLRITTTTQGRNQRNSTSSVYVLDENLQEIGKVEDLGKGESIYSVRFMGERAFVVTFRTVDPLYALDLSNPSDPKMLGELKIPGFSNYLHPYSENVLIGVGSEANPETGVTTGLKVSLFNVEDMQNPTESDTLILGGNGSYTEVEYEHKAFLFDRSRGILVLPVTLRDYGVGFEPRDRIALADGSEFRGFVAIDVTENSLTERGRVEFSEKSEAISSYYSYSPPRSMIIRDRLLAVWNQVLKSVDLSNMESYKSMSLTEAYRFDE